MSCVADNGRKTLNLGETTCVHRDAAQGGFDFKIRHAPRVHCSNLSMRNIANNCCRVTIRKEVGPSDTQMGGNFELSSAWGAPVVPLNVLHPEVVSESAARVVEQTPNMPDDGFAKPVPDP